jgi:hypothetical protein
MAVRSLVLLSVVAAAFSFAPSAHADVPPGTGGSTTTTTTAATGAGGATNDTNCTVAEESIAGSTCQECNPTTSACTSLGSDYNFVCQSSGTVAVWCNGPIRNAPSDQNTSCSVSVPGAAWSGVAAACALMAAAALGLRRRRSA